MLFIISCECRSIFVSTFIIVVSYALAYKCHVDFDEAINETKKFQYEKNLTEGNKFLPNDLIEKKETNDDAIKNEGQINGKSKIRS